MNKLPLPFLLLFLLFEVFGWSAHWMLGKDNLFFLLNGSKGVGFDYFWFVCTLLGEWPMIVMVIFIYWFYNKKRLSAVLAAFSLNGILAFILKQYIFVDALRPAAFYKEKSADWDLFLSPYLETAYYHSFPSGHTFTAFVGFTLLAFLSKNIAVQFFLFLLAFFAGYSRIYNGFHFPEDVLTGALLGVFLSVIMYTFVPAFKIKQGISHE
jgi:membrane-associated phospholipid phosphatase